MLLGHTKEAASVILAWGTSPRSLQLWGGCLDRHGPLLLGYAGKGRFIFLHVGMNSTPDN